jgi:hypothetical protein
MRDVEETMKRSNPVVIPFHVRWGNPRRNLRQRGSWRHKERRERALARFSALSFEAWLKTMYEPGADAVEFASPRDHVDYAAYCERKAMEAASLRGN